MPITSSAYTTDAHSQAGGGRWTVELHTDTLGRVHMAGPYLWDGVADRDALLASRAAQINEQLAADEANLLMEA